jgi:oligoendopeptidase F
MKRMHGACALLIALAAWGAPAAAERAEIPEKYTWNLADLYPSVQAWRESRDKLLLRLPELSGCQGRLGESPQSLYRALTLLMDLKKEAVRLDVYAVQLRDQDRRDAQAAALLQEAEQTMNRFQEASSFIQPEILSLDPKQVDLFVAAEPGLAPFRPFLADILRRKQHTLSPQAEEILAQTRIMAATPDNLYGTFTGADLPYPEQVALPSGIVAPRLDPAGYAKYRALPDAADRDKVFEAFWGTYHRFRRTLGASLYGHLMSHLFIKNVRRYGSCLEAALDDNAIPTSVYTQLLSDVHRNLPVLHRYLRLRQRMLGVERLRYEDLYVPMVKGMDATYTPEQAMDLTLAALAPLGKDYVETLRRGFASRWIDWMPSTGKRSGAYSEGAAYDVHPYQLLNFNGRYDDVSTLAHESGHSMHYYLSNHHQPYVTSEHAIFVAEVASTLNEQLLYRYAIDRAKDDSARLFLLGQHLESYRQTLFRQALFAEFELKIHQMAEAGQPLTGDTFCSVYLDLLRGYYGHDAGICEVKELYGAEWAFIHHFYYDFYVYQYATSLTASTLLSESILDEAARKGRPSTKARDAYLRLLESGCSKYPVDLLKDAGVDMTTSAPFDAAMREMTATMDRIEAILDRK